MSHTPANPSGSSPANFNPSEVTEFYLAGANDTLAVGDLIPLTSGGDGLTPTRTANRTTLHNLTDLVSVGALQGVDGDIEVYLPTSGSKYKLLWDSWKSGDYLKYNMFYRDGSGHAGWLVVTEISPTTGDDQFSQTVSLSTFNVNLIDPSDLGSGS